MNKSKKDTRKSPIVYFDTPTQPEPDPLPDILFTTRPDIEKPYPLGTDTKTVRNEMSYHEKIDVSFTLID